MRLYRKRPIVVEAIQWTGDNLAEVQRFADLFLRVNPTLAEVWVKPEATWVRCPAGHYVIKGVNGEFYPCAPAIFETTYEAVGEEVPR